MAERKGPGALGGRAAGAGNAVHARTNGSSVACRNDGLKPGRAAMSVVELRALLVDLRRVAGDPFAEDWPRSFAASIVAQAANPKWRPSVKQAQVMRRLARKARDDGGDVIEREDGEAGDGM